MIFSVQDVIIFGTTFVAALMSSMSGGGASIITFPVFLAMGLPFPLVSSVSAVNSVFWVVPAARNYLKGKQVDWVFIGVFSFLGLIGSYLGVLLVVNVNQRILEICVGGVILCLVVYTYIRKGLGLKRRPIYSRMRQSLAYIFSIPLGFYETVFGSGNGIAFTMITFYTKGFDFIEGLGHYYAIAFFWVFFSATLLISKGFYDIRIMVLSTLGAILGAHLGSRYARSKGNAFIKFLFVMVGGILGLKLLFGL
jgi:uncharacterized membrane protein YfcA